MMAATASQQPRASFGQKVMGSARGLARSTFAGVPGVDAELRNPLVGITGKQISTHPCFDETMAGEVSTPRSNVISHLNWSFRSTKTDLSQEAEFEQFTNDLATLPGLHVSASWVAKEREMLRRRGLIAGNETSFDEEVWTHSQCMGSTMDVDPFPAEMWQLHDAAPGTPLGMSIRSEVQSTAVERLRQVERHLAGPPMVHDSGMGPATPLPREDEEAEHATLFLRCQNIDCHNRLAQQNMHLPASIKSRCCVHSDCGYVSENLSGWLKHCASAHHVLQGRDSEGKNS